MLSLSHQLFANKERALALRMCHGKYVCVCFQPIFYIRCRVHFFAHILLFSIEKNEKENQEKKGGNRKEPMVMAK